eukprot:GEMP01001586.1.p1 GENE.GEMP01001586.1~~GEMP01001586.1.p1  ORF type:complete len:1227 (+),score=271.26 GEMP01001586.1:286-3966(+)
MDAGESRNEIIIDLSSLPHCSDENGCFLHACELLRSHIRSERQFWVVAGRFQMDLIGRLIEVFRSSVQRIRTLLVEKEPQIEVLLHESKVIRTLERLRSGEQPLSENLLERITSAYHVTGGISTLNAARNDEAAIFGRDGPHIMKVMDLCSVCMEARPSLKLCDNDCEGTCEDCLLQYFSIAVGKALYAMPMIRCPGTCQARIPTNVWTRFARSEDVARYKNNAIALLAVRCSACDETVSLFMEEGVDGAAQSDESVVTRERRSARTNSDFRSSDIRTGTPTSSSRSRRLPNDGSPLNVLSTRSARLSRASDGDEAEYDENKSTVAPVVFKRPRIPLDDAFKHSGPIWLAFWCGSIPADNFLDALMRQVTLHVIEKALYEQNLLIQIEDLERRLAFQLAYLSKFPKIRTPCCGDKMCYKCKVGNWHIGMSCEQRQRKEAGKEVQFCPNCHVPTHRSEGCNQIHCVCGEDWSWEADDEDDDDFDSDEDHSNALNLVAMSNVISPDVSQTLATQIAQAGGLLTVSLGVACRSPGVLRAALESGLTPNEEDYEALHASNPGKELTREVEQLLFSSGNVPPWASFYLPDKNVSDYDALSDAEARDHRLFVALLRLRMGWRTDEEKGRSRAVLARAAERLGFDVCRTLAEETATLELRRELSEAIGFRTPDIEYVRSLLEVRADVTYRAENEARVDGDPHSPLEMVLVNQAKVAELEEATVTVIKLLIERSVDLNEENEEGDPPLKVAMQYRNAAAVETMLTSNLCTVTPLAIEELLTISDNTKRRRIEDAILARVQESPDLGLDEIETWALIQIGVSSKIVSTSFSEVDLKGFLRTRAGPAAQKQIQKTIQKEIGKKLFLRYRKRAATMVLLEELREACEWDREIDFAIVEKSIKLGADFRAREEDTSDDEDDMCNALELISMNWSVGHFDSTRKLIELIVKEGGRSVLNASDEDGSVALGIALRFGNWAVAKVLIENGSEISDSIWVDCHKCFGSVDIYPILEMLFAAATASGTEDSLPIWLLLRLHKLDLGEKTLTQLEEHHKVLQAADGDTDDGEEVVPLYAGKLLCVAWLVRKRDEEDERFERIVRGAYALIKSDRTFEDGVKRAATHLLLSELRWALNFKRTPNVERVQMFLHEEADPNVKENELSDYVSLASNEDDESDSDFDSDNDHDTNNTATDSCKHEEANDDDDDDVSGGSDSDYYAAPIDLDTDNDKPNNANSTKRTSL